MDKRGILFVIAGPSGVGKGTLVKMLLEKHPEIKLSISATTRKPRKGEIDGVHYFFISKEKFLEKIGKEEFIEWAEFSGNYYGTYFKTVEDSLNSGRDIILEIEVQGAKQIKEKLSQSKLIFILPPSKEELKNRLIGRNSETEEAIKNRLAQVEREYKEAEKFDFKVVNDNLETALVALEELIFSIKGV
ncbi:MAG: guanylate kinase [Candidatus Gastranaerophilaceae bacterium]|jgi:guanylate kinase